MPIGELFAHMSGLYFRGKITYAQRFGRPFVITPDQGLIPADQPVTSQVLVRFALRKSTSRILPTAFRSSRPRASLPRPPDADAEFVLLGSVASEKYVQVLTAIFGSRLVFPPSFVGRGDMSRGGLLLRAAAAGEELEYVPVLGAIRTGSRPPKLVPPGDEPRPRSPSGLAEPSGR